MRQDKKLLSLSSKFPESGGGKQVCQESEHLDFNDGQFNWGKKRERESRLREAHSDDQKSKLAVDNVEGKEVTQLLEDFGFYFYLFIYFIYSEFCHTLK